MGGLEAQVERYRDSPMMGVNSPDEMKPILLKAGRRVAFPEPTQVLAESKSNKQRSLTCDHFSHGTGENHMTPTLSSRSTCAASELSGTDDSESQMRAYKKSQRSMKRIKSKLGKLVYSRPV